MKRFMLVSLMSCMLVGQTSCDWQTNAIGFGKGMINSMARSAGAACLFGLFLGPKGSVAAAGSSAFCSAWRASNKLEDATEVDSAIPVERAWHAGGLIAGSATTAAIIVGLAAKGIIDLSSK